jgi:hypothetical protein
MPAQDFEAQHNAIDMGCRVLDTARGSLSEADVGELLAPLAQEPPMNFPQSTEQVQARKFDGHAVPVPGFSVDRMVLAYDRASMETRNQVKVVTTARKRYSFAASIEMPDVSLPEPAWIAIRLRITKGQVGIGILDKDKNDFSSRTFFDAGNGSETVYIKIKPTPGRKSLMIENGDVSGASRVEIESVRVISGAG